MSSSSVEEIFILLIMSMFSQASASMSLRLAKRSSKLHCPESQFNPVGLLLNDAGSSSIKLILL